jgi:hypothetical protein
MRNDKVRYYLLAVLKEHTPEIFGPFGTHEERMQEFHWLSSRQYYAGPYVWYRLDMWTDGQMIRFLEKEK